ncbi:MAG: hypothetical protein ON057_001838 [Glomeribacter sp. 1016415]|uniref:Antitoxin n=1 Tax=Mycoavidus cysteinexigens TaxID=1553431 RepID=A0A2Z6EV95_9BURK|nr:hypothetical protein [Mycoavidus cysteinexigens]MCX8567111.1 hypothetical protein [Glomeribacter sp. 1016415]BBE09341.1 Antitoxin [Mycoavidus cysteinexigens]GAM51900.1 hypothetical protein EBME_0363 [bacterium endosymbiont of Mortierella elongata FMR23-6]GLR01927.1 hypothetical protein GCM10007934_17400 [Mycoavidus cysteinexigens]
MQVVDIYEAQIKLCSLIEAALAGEQIVIADADRFLVKLVPWEQGVNITPPTLRPRRFPNIRRALPKPINTPVEQLEFA